MVNTSPLAPEDPEVGGAADDRNRARPPYEEHLGLGVLAADKLRPLEMDLAAEDLSMAKALSSGTEPSRVSAATRVQQSKRTQKTVQLKAGTVASLDSLTQPAQSADNLGDFLRRPPQSWRLRRLRLSPKSFPPSPPVPRSSPADRVGPGRRGLGEGEQILGILCQAAAAATGQVEQRGSRRSLSGAHARTDIR